jgi:hypothetical protein
VLSLQRNFDIQESHRRCWMPTYEHREKQPQFFSVYKL